MLRRYGFFTEKTLIRKLTLQKQHKKVMTKLAMLRRYGFFTEKTLIRKLTLQQSHQKTCQASKSRVFSVKNTHSQTDITTKSSKNLPCFDVTGFFSKKHSFAN